MKIKKTRKEALAEFILGFRSVGAAGGYAEDNLDAAALVLGVEFAPEKPELPEWFGKEEVVVAENVALVELKTLGGAWLAGFSEKETGRGLGEGYNRFVRMKRGLERLLKLGAEFDSAPAITAIRRLNRIARGEE